MQTKSQGGGYACDAATGDNNNDENWPVADRLVPHDIIPNAWFIACKKRTAHNKLLDSGPNGCVAVCR